MTHQKYKERLIPEQNKTLIAGICVCQLTVVLSIVSFIYLSVAIYIPSHRAFTSGFDSTPVVCQTIETTMINNCSWASCGEWCLTKTTGYCPQIHVNVRRNGTDLLLENCTRISNYACPKARSETLQRYNCNNGTQCSSLTGVFNCSLGHCANMSEMFQCHYKADGITVDSEKDNMKLNGFFECKHSRCTKIKKHFSCDRYCPKITTVGVNAFLMYDDYLYTGDCQRAVAFNSANGSSKGYPVLPTEIWSEEKSKKWLFTACAKVEKGDGNSLRATDCINGTVLPETGVPSPYMNFTQYWTLLEKSNESVDPTERFIPKQKTLTIYEKSKLYINLDGCVNTLKGECRDFTETNGRDGRNNTAQSRLPCYHNPDNSVMAIARFDLERTWKELLVAVVVPAVLFVISFTTLMIITRSVKVGDDSILRCQLCAGLIRPKKDEDDDRSELAHSKSRNNIPKVMDNNGGATVL